LGLAMLVFALSAGRLIDNIVAGNSVSNISRMASQTAAFNEFLDYPLFGVGFGQFGFHVSEYLPYWGYYSWELQPWLIYPEAPWPAVYSIYARLAAETGIVGIVGWVGFWIWLARRIVIGSRFCQRVTGSLPVPSYPLVMSCYCVLTSSFAYDSFRTPMFWITLGLGARYLEEINQLARRYAAATHVQQQLKVASIAPEESAPEAETGVSSPA
jgi:O-antigen ligase